MMTRTKTRHRLPAVVFASLVLATVGMPPGLIARPRPPLPPLPEFALLLSRAGFDEPFWARTEKPESFHPAYSDLVDGWSGYALRRSGLVVTPFVVPALDEAGHTNVACASGAVRFWFKPDWSSGLGPGGAARLIELSAVGERDAVACWALVVSADGSTLALAGLAGDLLRAEIDWQAGEWHSVTLNYGPKGSALFLDGRLAAQGAGVAAIPSAVAALTVGSTLAGADAAQGEFDEVAFFARPLTEIVVAFGHQLYAATAARGAISAEEEAALREAAAKRRAERAAAGEGGGTQMLRLLGGTSQCITSPVVFITNIVAGFDTNAGWTNMFDIQGGTNGFFYDIFTTANLTGDSITNSQWTWLERGPTCSTYLYTNQPPAYAFYVLGTSQDTDNDGLTDAYEQLVSKTATNVGNSPRAIYEAVIASQSPSNWFKLNDGSLTNAISGQAALTNTGTWDVDAFATGSNAIQFNGTSQRMTAGGVISGGTGTNQGSMSLLFRSLTGYPTTLLSTQRYVFSQRGNATNEFGLFFETNDPPVVDPGSLKVRIGSQTNTILASNAIVFGTWYYLAMTWNESSNLATWYLAPIGGTLNTSNINFGATNAVGNSSNVVFGNRQSAPGNNNSASNYPNAFRTPGNGALDQIAFWNRELTGPEVNAQFNTLTAVLQGPSKVFDLTRWNILLPVDQTNGLNANNLALEISTGWLNSGFRYVDPADWTQKYFYRSGDDKMVFEAPWNGARSSGGSGARSELRETKADGSKNNWLPLGTNTLDATCIVHSAGTNGTNKVIIGQIHSDTADDPPVVISYNFPSNKYVTATYKLSPKSSLDRNFTLATNVNLFDQIRYQMQLSGDGTNIILHGEAAINNVLQTPTLDIPLALSSTNAWHTNTFYFKAGCYYPTNASWSAAAGTAKVTFSNLTITHKP